MSAQRLSKLQKWILEQSIKRVENNTWGLDNHTCIAFFGKEFMPKYKSQKLFEFEWEYSKMEDKSKLDKFEGNFNVWDGQEKKWVVKTKTYFKVKDDYILSEAEQVTISRSLKNMVGKGLLWKQLKYGPYFLSEAGFLIAKKSVPRCTILNFKDYQQALEAIRTGNIAHFNAITVEIKEKLGKVGLNAK